MINPKNQNTEKIQNYITMMNPNQVKRENA